MNLSLNNYAYGQAEGLLISGSKNIVSHVNIKGSGDALNLRGSVYLTDSRKPAKSKDANYQESAAHWEGTRLVSEEKGLHGGRITRTYELTPDGKQLNENVRLDNTHTGLITVRYVFDVAASSTPAAAPASK